MIASRPFGVAKNINVSAQPPMATGARTLVLKRLGLATVGNRPDDTDPRVGSARPLKNITPTIRRNGRSAATPGSAWPPAFGYQLRVTPRKGTSAWVIATPNAAATVSPNEVRPPTSATLSAGTMSNVIVNGSTDFWLPATRMPKRPEM